MTETLATGDSNGIASVNLLLLVSAHEIGGGVCPVPNLKWMHSKILAWLP